MPEDMRDTPDATTAANLERDSSHPAVRERKASVARTLQNPSRFFKEWSLSSKSRKDMTLSNVRYDASLAEIKNIAASSDQKHGTTKEGKTPDTEKIAKNYTIVRDRLLQQDRYGRVLNPVGVAAKHFKIWNKLPVIPVNGQRTI